MTSLTHVQKKPFIFVFILSASFFNVNQFKKHDKLFEESNQKNQRGTSIKQQLCKKQRKTEEKRKKQKQKRCSCHPHRNRPSYSFTRREKVIIWLHPVLPPPPQPIAPPKERGWAQLSQALSGAVSRPLALGPRLPAPSPGTEGQFHRSRGGGAQEIGEVVS